HFEPGIPVRLNAIPITPNQILSITAQLDLGARLLDLDIHDPDGDLRLRHSIAPFGPLLPKGIPVLPTLNKIRAWLDRPENQQEVVLLFLQDETGQTEEEADDKLLPKLQEAFGSLIYTPAERAADDRWPSRRELATRGDRVILFHNRSKDELDPFSPK